MIEVKNSKIHGRGVFATQFINKGTELTCDVVLIPKDKEQYYNELDVYSFAWDKNYYSVCFGFASFLNHSKTPNTRHVKIDKENLKFTFLITEDINIGGELTLNYRSEASRNFN